MVWRTHATRIKKQIPYDLGAALATLPPGQRRAVQALIGGNGARTYPEAARLVGVGLGTLLTHINRVRERHPRLYEAVRAVRLAQLAERHAEALQNAQAHSRRYFRKRAARRYFERFGRWPWDRRRFSSAPRTGSSTGVG